MNVLKIRKLQELNNAYLTIIKPVEKFIFVFCKFV